MKKIKLKGSRFHLSRESDGEGDSGHLLVSINPDTMDSYQNEIRVGCCVQCGSLYARSMQWQDYWMTTPVTEILEVTTNTVKFKTKNSIYIVESN